jgi:uncharacterized protein
MIRGIQSLSEHVFSIPHRGRYIVYMPLTGVAMLANAGMVNCLHEALQGSRSAWKRLKGEPALVAELKELSKRNESWPPADSKQPFKPVQVSLFLTSDCTLRCRYCYAAGGERKKEMPWEVVTGVIDETVGNAVSAGSGWISVHFHGGGDVGKAWPLLKRARDYAERAADSNSILVRTSAGLNGILNSEQRGWIIANIDNATVSIDGPPDLHDSQRPFPDGSPSFGVVAETLKEFDAARFKYGIRTTVSAEGVSRLEETVDFFCGNFSAETIKAEPLYPRGRSETTGLQPPKAADFIRHFIKARRIARGHGRDLVYSGARLETVSTVFCRAAGDSCAVTPDGDITSCYEVLSPEDRLSETFFYGRFDGSTRKMVIDQERWKRLRELSVLHEPLCQTCFCKWHCAGDCPVKHLHSRETDPGGIPARCRINRELTKARLIEAMGLR